MRRTEFLFRKLSSIRMVQDEMFLVKSHFIKKKGLTKEQKLLRKICIKALF